LPLPLIALAFLALLAVGYWRYSGFVARQLALDPAATTPARAVNDGADFVPTRPFYLFGQHFSAIAAAGPIAGPILACQTFGWLPCLVWIALGVVFIGAVHDFLALAASVRHGARSIAEIAREQLGSPAGRALLAFIGIALVYVIVAFTDITAGTFVEGSEELQGSGASFHKGGAVAAASALYLLLAIVLGLVRKLWPKLPLWLLTIVFVPATFGVTWCGTLLADRFVLDHRTWVIVIVAYCGLASITPVSLLLQPRGYLGGFVLYSALAAGVVGVFLGGPVAGIRIEQPAVNVTPFGGLAGALGAMFPFLFVTIACGACSGFHGLVCSGTTSKQVDREPHARPVGYGAMLAEAFVALIALATVMTVAPAAIAGRSPGRIYGDGIGRFVTLVIGERHLAFATTFGAMAFSTFVFDTLDVSTRLGRYIAQELLGWKGRAGSAGATLVTVAAPLLILLGGEKNDYQRFWTLFGASNQLLAALTLLTLTVWLRRSGRRFGFALAPMLFVLAITLWALVRLAVSNFSIVASGGAAGQSIGVALVNGIAACAFVVLALFLAAAGARRLREPRPEHAAPVNAHP